MSELGLEHLRSIRSLQNQRRKALFKVCSASRTIAFLIEADCNFSVGPMKAKSFSRFALFRLFLPLLVSLKLTLRKFAFLLVFRTVQTAVVAIEALWLPLFFEVDDFPDIV